MHPHLAVCFLLHSFKKQTRGELKCNCFKNISTLLCTENIFCEPSLLTKYLKQLHPCREEAGCATCPNSSHQLLAVPSLAGQPQHHKVDGQRQNSKQVTVAENKCGSVSSTVDKTAFRAGAIDNIIIGTCQSRYPTACA